MFTGDMVFLGHTNMFRFNHPEEAAKLREHRRVSGRVSTDLTEFILANMKTCFSYFIIY